MVTFRNKRKLAALNKEKCEEHPRSNLAQNSNVPGSQEDFITQVSEEIEGRFTKKLSQEFSRTENRILGALSRLDDILLTPLIQGHSGTDPETTRNAYSSNHGTNEDDIQSDPHPAAGIFGNHMTQNSSPEEVHDNSIVKILTRSLSYFTEIVIHQSILTKLPCSRMHLDNSVKIIRDQSKPANIPNTWVSYT